MWLVAELFEALPEAGDLPQPKLVVFLDEAHLLFDDATDAFLDALARTVRLIRSKGVGVFFVTQQPTDLSEEVLAQLGLRIQHALRAFTPSDAKKLRATVSTYPRSELYDVETLLTSVGHRRGGGHAAVGEGRADAGRAHAAARAVVEHGPGRRRRRRREGVAAVGEVRRAGRRAERARDARRRLADAPAPEPEPSAPMEHVPLPRKPAEPRRRRRPRGRARTRSATSCARGRARRSSARSRAASSGCCASGSSARHRTGSGRAARRLRRLRERGPAAVGEALRARSP